MAKNSKFKNIFEIMTEGFKIYFKNLFSLSQPMLFPVFGQIGGIIAILAPVYFYSQNVFKWAQVSPFLNNIAVVFLILILITLPGFFLFVKAFWEYMVVMVTQNLMASDISKGYNQKETYIYNQMVKIRTKDYIVVLSLVCLVWLVALIAPVAAFLIGLKHPLNVLLFVFLEALAITVLMIMTIYLGLIFQIVAFEDISPVDTLKRSIKLINGNFWRTTAMGVALLVFTTAIAPFFVKEFFSSTFLVDILATPIHSFVAVLIPDPQLLTGEGSPVAMLFSSNNPIKEISDSIFLETAGGLVTALLLPLGSACYTILYKDITFRHNAAEKKKYSRRK